MFTPQQMSGGPKYSSKVKIGNWDEDRSRFEEELKDFEYKKSNGSLLLSEKQRQRLIATENVPHSYSSDGYVHVGDTVLIAHEEELKSGDIDITYIANNIWDIHDVMKRTMSASAVTEAKPMARNTFEIRRSKADPYAKGNVLCYGDRIYLASNPSLRTDPKTKMYSQPYYLGSEASSAIHGTGSGKRQDVFMTLQVGPLIEWQVVAADGNNLLKDGQPVPVGEEVGLRHSSTNQCLAISLADRMPGSFGAAYEVALHALTYKSKGRTSSEKSLPLLKTNRFKFVYSSNPRAAEDNRGIKPLTAEGLLEKIRETILARGGYGFRGLSRSFRIMDDAGDGRLDKEDFKWGLKDYGVALTDEEFDMVFNVFDDNKDGYISFTEFLVALRPTVNAHRMTFIKEAYRRLDKDGSGLVTLTDIEQAYDTSYHPEVINGTMTREEALLEFMSQWDTQEKDSIITLEEFVDYYTDISAAIDSDDYFELMMRNAWHISGGKGWSENTSCIRALVEHSDGSQEVVEVKDDLGVSRDDMEEIRARLEAQGISDMKRISLAD